MKQRNRISPTACTVIFAVLVNILAISPATAVAQAPNQQESEILQQFRKTAKELKYLNLNNAGLQYPFDNHPELRDSNSQAKIYRLIQNADKLPVELLDSTDPRERALACAVFGLADNPRHLQKISTLCNDPARTIDSLYISEVTGGGEIPQKQTVGGAAVSVLYARTGLVGNELFNCEHPPKYFQQQWAKIENPLHWPQEWLFRIHRANSWNEPLEPIRQQIGELPKPVRTLVVGVIRHPDNYPAAFSREEFVQFAKADLDAQTLRDLLAGRYKHNCIHALQQSDRRPTQDDLACRESLLAVAEDLFTPAEARWLFEQTDPASPLYWDFVLAAVRTDPSQAWPWLKAAIDADPSSYRRAALMALLWTRYRDAHPNITAHMREWFYRDKPGTNRFDAELQDTLLRRLVKPNLDNPQSQGRGYEPSARALVVELLRDERAVRLGWSPCEELARQAETLDAKLAEPAQSLWKLRHPLQPEQFDAADPLVLAKKHPTETLEAQRAIAAFAASLHQWAKTAR